MPSLPSDAPRTPVQQRVVDLLGAKPGERPEFPTDLSDRLRHDLERQLDPVVKALPTDEPALWVSKHDLASIHGCEVRFLAERDQPFAWTVQLARGTVTHKAIELSLGWRGELVPLELVDEAMASIERGDRSLGEFLRTAGEADLAALRVEANERVAAFLDVFPPLDRRWRPVVEARLRAELCGDRIVLNGRIDLALGQPTGMVAGKVLIDFKTGTTSLHHRDDLRFYALIETLRLGVPPRRLATVYLDSGRIDTEEMTDGLLDATVRRVTDGIARLASLTRAPDDAAFRPGNACRWCVLADTCGPGQEHLAEVGRRNDDLADLDPLDD